MVKLRKSLILFAVLVIVMMTGYFMFAIHEVKSEEPDNYIRVSCFTQNNISLGYLKIGSIAFENNTIILLGSSIFEAVGNNPTLLFSVKSSGSSPLPLTGEVIADVSFYVANGSRNYGVSFSNRTLVVDSTLFDNSVQYTLNLHEKIEQAKNQLGYNGSIDTVGIRGRFSLEVMLRNPVGTNNQRRFTNVIVNGNANLDTILYDFQIPETAKLTEATVGSQTMQKSGVPYRVETSIGLTPFESFEKTFYLEWEVSEEPLWLLSPPYSWILSALVGAICVSIPVRYLTDRSARPKLSIKVPRKGANEPAIHPNNGIVFYHLIVENNGKSSATDAELTLRFRNQTGVELFNLTGKWDRGPEPIGPIINGQPTPMPSLIPFAERINIRKKTPEPFCVVIKDNQAECYAFNCTSYFHGFKNGNWQLPLGDFIVEVEVRSGNAEKRQHFLLRNSGTTVQDVEIQELPQ